MEKCDMKGGKGWHESPDASGKAPDHRDAKLRAQAKGANNTPMVKTASKWTDERILNELKRIQQEIGHFPAQKELNKSGYSGLAKTISRHGGMNPFKELLGVEILRAPTDYWTDEIIIKELKKIKKKEGHFPAHEEIRAMKRSGLSRAIPTHGGINKFRELLGDEILQTSAGYWTKETVINDLIKIKEELNHYPTGAELRAIGRGDLVYAIWVNGGTNKFRKLLGDGIIQASIGYWTDEIIIKELNKIKANLGHFPTQKEVIELKQSGLTQAIARHGGYNRFREILGDEILKVADGYWTDETIIKELKKATDKLGYFPTRSELRSIGHSDLTKAIPDHGGIDKFRRKLGYPSLLEDFAGLNTYITSRGYKSEKEVKNILIEYCKRKGIPEPNYNKKLSKGNVIEFVCGSKIGIDVTNTKNRSGWSIRRKYIEKDYSKFLDRLWIIVVSNVFTINDYIRFNEESPNNVEIMSVWDLIERLQIDIDEHSRRKLEALETCTLRTKDDLINNLKNRTLGKYI